MAPGITDTEMTLDMPERQKMMLKVKTPLGKLAQTKDIASTVTFLASDSASHITGQVIHVNGGIF